MSLLLLLITIEFGRDHISISCLLLLITIEFGRDRILISCLKICKCRMLSNQCVYMRSIGRSFVGWLIWFICVKWYVCITSVIICSLWDSRSFRSWVEISHPKISDSACGELWCIIFVIYGDILVDTTYRYCCLQGKG